MNKPPAFQFYADDFIGGTVDLDAEQVGAYIRLLCYQWNKGAIPDGTAIVNRIAGCEVCNEVLSKFPNGRNPRMEAVRAELEAFRAKQSSNGASGAKKRWRCHDLANGQTIAKAWPNDSSPSPSPIEINKEGAPKLDEVLAFGQMRGLSKSDCEQFWHHFESTGWIDKNGHPIKKWQSKLMTWKANAPQTPPFAPGSVAATKPRQPFISELKAVLEAKKAQRQRIVNRGSESLNGFTARDKADADDFKKLNKEIGELMNRIAEAQI